MPTRKILIALTSHGKLGSTGRDTGFYLPEVAHPWKVFTDASYTVDLVSVQGGRPPADGIDPSDPVQQAFLDDPDMSVKLTNTLRPDQVTSADYDAIFYAGGHGTMWDFPGATRLAEIARDIYENNGVVAAVCHGPAGLVNITLSDGRYLVDGKEVTGFTNDEETAVGLAEDVPFLLQALLEQRGAKHTGAPNFQPWVVRDGRLITGQNPASATGVAQQVLTALNENEAEAGT
jgi:putative intracellular protease/amidase